MYLHKAKAHDDWMYFKVHVVAAVCSRFPHRSIHIDGVQRCYAHERVGVVANPAAGVVMGQGLVLVDHVKR